MRRAGSGKREAEGGKRKAESAEGGALTPYHLPNLFSYFLPLAACLFPHCGAHMAHFRFKDLDIWHKDKDLAVKFYKVADTGGTGWKNVCKLSNWTTRQCSLASRLLGKSAKWGKSLKLEAESSKLKAQS